MSQLSASGGQSTGEGNGKPLIVFLPWEPYEQYEKAYSIRDQKKEKELMSCGGRLQGPSGIKSNP